MSEGKKSVLKREKERERERLCEKERVRECEKEHTIGSVVKERERER